MYGTVTWLNAIEELGKLKKGTELFSTLFVFKSGIVLLVQERLKGKKRLKGVSGDVTKILEYLKKLYHD